MIDTRVMQGSAPFKRAASASICGSPSTDGEPGWSRVAWRLVAPVALAALVVRRWLLFGEFPPGLDGGQWLALGRGLTEAGRSTEGAYAPLVPALVAAAGGVLGPLPAVRLVAVVSFAATLLALLLVARVGLDRWTALGVTLLVGSASAAGEPIAYGGYPQTVAFAALLFAVAATARALATGERHWWLGVALALAAAAAAHHVYGPLAIATVLTVVAAHHIRARLTPDGGIHPGLAETFLKAVGTKEVMAAVPAEVAAVAPIAVPAAMAAVVPGIVVAALVWWSFLRAGYQAPLAAAGFGHREAFAYATREAPLVWGIILAAGIAAVVPTGRTSRSVLWPVALALIAVPGAVFLFAPEARLLPPILAGGALGFGLALGAGSRVAGRIGPAASAAVLGALLVLLVPRADALASAYVDYYRVVDPSLIRAAAVVDADAGTGLVVVRENRRGWPVGWWFEGLTRARIATGSDPRWLGFPAERQSAEIAARFFAPGVDGAELRALAAEAGVELVVLRKWEWIGWRRWLAEPAPAVEVLFDDDEHLLLRIVQVNRLPKLPRVGQFRIASVGSKHVAQVGRSRRRRVLAISVSAVKDFQGCIASRAPHQIGNGKRLGARTRDS